ncbi:MAG: ABC transporter ATP-binding protein/permease [Oscillospiraceae bacterium]|jgi:ABC-type multidrug transport system fused ATPase/permease subunit|nr:ABC transporter ATP-binding protein/permease [Oscillospiraceae bacterium]
MPKKKDDRIAMRPNLRYMLGNWRKWDGKSFWVIAACIPAQIALPALTALIPKLMLDAINGAWAPGKLIALVAVLSSLIAFLSWIEPNLSEKLRVSAQLARMNYRILALRKIMRIDYETLESLEGREKLEKAKDFCFGGRWSGGEDFYDAVRQFLASGIGLLTFAGLLTQLNPLLLLIIIIGCVAEVGANIIGNRFMHKMRKDSNQAFMRIEYMYRSTKEAEKGKDVRLYNMRPWFLRIMQSAVDVHNKVLGKFVRQLIGGAVSLRTIATLAREAAAYFFLVRAVLAGDITPADFLFFFGIVTGFSAWLMTVTRQYGNIERCYRECQRFRDYMDLPDCTQGGSLPCLGQGHDGLKTIEFRNVSFTYKGSDEPVLHNVSFTINKGEKIAIVGENGAGKTTLIKLLCGFYPPTEGQILVNGVDIREYDRESYYKLFGAVFQDFTFLPVTVAQNVTITEKGAEDTARLEESLRKAGLLDKMRALPDGLESPMVKDVWERAVNFSGGERQRLLLARALYKDAPVLILDEPTAALDPIAENRLYQQYAEFSHDKTSFFISHRIASTRFCGRIFYMANAHIAEEGTHEELLALQGAYYKMFETQSYYYRKNTVGEDE